MITDPASLRELFTLAGERIEDYVELLPISPFYRLMWEDGRGFDYVNDQAQLEAQIASFRPADVEGYRRFLAYSRDLYREGYQKLGAVPFLGIGSMVAAAPQLVRLQAWRSVYDMVASFIEDEHLRQAFSFHSLLVRCNPFATSAIYALIHALEREGGVWFPRGGTGALVRGLVRLFEKLGGTVRLSSPVEAIITDGARATDLRAGGERIATTTSPPMPTWCTPIASCWGRTRRVPARASGWRASGTA